MIIYRFLFVITLYSLVCFQCFNNSNAGHAGIPPKVKLSTLTNQFASVRNSMFNQTFFVNNVNDPSPFGYINVVAYGAVGDGKTDNTEVFAAALSAGAGSKIFVPSGRYYFSGVLTIPPYTSLEGSNGYPFSGVGGGAILLAVVGAGNTTGLPFIFLQGPDSGIKGITILYPNQTADLTVPIPYPPCIQGKGDNLSVINMLLANPYIGIDFATYVNNRHIIENVYGQPISVGIKIDQVYDIGRIRHIHFWPFFAASGTPLDAWIHSNGITFLIYRTDWEVVEDVFSWGYLKGLVFDNSEYGACNGQFTDINFDDVDVGIDLLATQPYGLMFSNVNLANAGNGQDRIAIRCPENGDSITNIVMRGLVVWGQFNQAVYWNCGGKLTLSDGLIVEWNNKYSAIEAQSGRIHLRGLYFSDKIGSAITIGNKVDRAIVMANDLVGNSLICQAIHSECSNNLL